MDRLCYKAGYKSVISEQSIFTNGPVTNGLKYALSLNSKSVYLQCMTGRYVNSVKEINKPCQMKIGIKPLEEFMTQILYFNLG
jgi:hypothetical protein